MSPGLDVAGGHWPPAPPDASRARICSQRSRQASAGLVGRSIYLTNNIASQTENPTYHGVTVHLRDLITKNPKTAKNTESILTKPTAFTIQSTKAEQTCDYCRKKKDWSGRGHIEAECRTKR